MKRKWSAGKSAIILGRNIGVGATTEAMKRVIEFAMEELKLSQIVGRC